MEVYLGDSIRMQATLKDYDGTALDPDSHSVKLYDPSETERDSDTNPTQSDAGVYYSDLTIPSSGTVGLWKVWWEITIDSKTKQAVYEFYVGEAP